MRLATALGIGGEGRDDIVNVTKTVAQAMVSKKEERRGEESGRSLNDIVNATTAATHSMLRMDKGGGKWEISG